MSVHAICFPSHHFLHECIDFCETQSGQLVIQVPTLLIMGC
jgi:hypothetical protein